MNGFPYFQFHIDRWLTGHISSFGLLEQGLYIQFCMQAWANKGSFNINPTTLSRRYALKTQWINQTVKDFCDCHILEKDEQGYRIKFIDEQLTALADIRGKRSRAGLASAESRARIEEKSIEEKSSVLNFVQQTPAAVDTCSTHVNTCSTPVDTEKPKDAQFERCWILFGRYGVKAKALSYWRQLTQEQRDAIEAAIPEYLKAVLAGRKKMQLEGWINPKEQRWTTDWKSVVEVERQSTIKRKVLTPAPKPEARNPETEFDLAVMKAVDMLKACIEKPVEYEALCERINKSPLKNREGKTLWQVVSAMMESRQKGDMK